MQRFYAYHLILLYKNASSASPMFSKQRSWNWLLTGVLVYLSFVGARSRKPASTHRDYKFIRFERQINQEKESYSTPVDESDEKNKMEAILAKAKASVNDVFCFSEEDESALRNGSKRLQYMYRAGTWLEESDLSTLFVGRVLSATNEGESLIIEVRLKETKTKDKAPLHS